MELRVGLRVQEHRDAELGGAASSPENASTAASPCSAGVFGA